MLLAIEFNLQPAQSIFEPASPASHAIQSLGYLVFAIAALIFVIVEGVLFYCVWRFRQGRASVEPPQAYGSQAIEIAWTAAPGLIVLFLTLVIGRTLWEVEANASPPPADDDALYVTVTAHQWWWEYKYETYEKRTLGFITANELHIPIGSKDKPRPTHLTLVSADVCHSFWVPRLAGKVDTIPGRTNYLSLETQTPGLYLGQCAEYCGTQHANMLIRVIAEPAEDFERWFEEQMKPSADDANVRAGRETFLAESCINCHAIRGTPARGTYAPDLTHLMSRETLAASEIENNLRNLDAWVRDPQRMKEGCLMPAFGLSEEKRKLIVDYLATLR